MADKINAYGRTGLDISPARSRAVTPAGQESSGRQQAGKTDDAVDFSSTATNLKRLEAKLRDAPDIDRNRVDEVRQRIDAGDFQIDAQQLARKLLRLEQDLG